MKKQHSSFQLILIEDEMCFWVIELAKKSAAKTMRAWDLDPRPESYQNF
jgi:hypothetical protein